MNQYEDVATRYIASWNETDPAVRRATLEGLWASDGFDVAVLTADGKVQAVLGFLDRVPAAV